MQIFEANHPETSYDRNQIKEKLDHPQLAEILRSPSIIIINDHHRSTPSGRILDALVELYGEDHHIDYIAIASGTHEEPTDGQLDKLTHRAEDALDCEILIHDPLGREVDLVNLGKTKRGTQVQLHPVLRDYDNIVCINSVEPHYFAGFTGGIKSVIPGLAAKSTVEQNHSWAMSKNSGPTKLWDNPLQLDLWEAASFLKKSFFGIQLVNFQDNIFHISVGELRSAFENAVEVSKKIYTREVEDQFDAIVSMIYPPLDRSLYQAQKGIENTRQALKKGGEMILVAKCEEGIGNNAFYETMKQFNTPEEVMNSLSQETYSFGDHKGYKFATLANDSKITIIGDLTLNQAHNIFADARRISELEDILSDLSNQGKRIAMVIDSGSLVLLHSSK